MRPQLGIVYIWLLRISCITNISLNWAYLCNIIILFTAVSTVDKDNFVT